MSIDLEYAIKKDIRNNPLIRELDTRERRVLRRSLWLAVLSVALLLFSAWQNQKMVQHGMDMERRRTELAQEERFNRWLRLNLETLGAPKEIERRARELGMVPAPAAETLVIERAPAPAPRRGVIAQVN